MFMTPSLDLTYECSLLQLAWEVLTGVVASADCPTHYIPLHDVLMAMAGCRGYNQVTTYVFTMN